MYPEEILNFHFNQENLRYYKDNFMAVKINFKAAFTL